MSAIVKLPKDPLEPHDIGQPTAECHLMAWLYRRKLVKRRDELPPQRWCKRHRGACLGVEDEAFQQKDGYMDEAQSVKDGAEETDERVMTSHTQSHFRGGKDMTSNARLHRMVRLLAS